MELKDLKIYDPKSEGYDAVYLLTCTPDEGVKLRKELFEKALSSEINPNQTLRDFLYGKDDSSLEGFFYENKKNITSLLFLDGEVYKEFSNEEFPSNEDTTRLIKENNSIYFYFCRKPIIENI